MRKLLALTLSLLMVFSVVPAAMVSAEDYTYRTVFDADTSDGSNIVNSYNALNTSKPASNLLAIENGDHTKAYYIKKSGAYDGFAVTFGSNYRDYAKDAIGIRFWLAGDANSITNASGFSVGLKAKVNGATKYYKFDGEKKNNFTPTADGQVYEVMFSSYSKLYNANEKFNATYVSVNSSTVFTEQVLGNLQGIMIGRDEGTVSDATKKAGFYVDDVELIFPANHTYAPLEYIASFEGTETATLTADVEDIKSDVQNNDAVVMPEATLAEGELEGWALNGDFTKLYAPGEVANITANTTFYAVRKDRPALATPAAPTTSAVTGFSVTLNKVDGAVYSMDGATWQTSNVFSGLTPGSTYTFYQKLSETLEYAESASSEGLTVTLPIVYKWNLYSDNFTITENTTSNANFSTQYSAQGTYFFGTGLAAGQTVTFVSLADVQPGVYSAKLWARTTGSRAPIDVEINGVKVKSALNTGTNNGYDTAFALDEATVEIYEAGPITLKLTTTGSGGLYLNALELEKIADVDLGTTRKVKIDGEVVAEVELGSEYTIPTPPTGYYYSDGNNDYYGGEVVVIEGALNLLSEVLTAKVVYTMDEGKQMASAATANIGYGKETAEYFDVDGNMKLALKVKGDQTSYFKLPADWSSKPYYKPVSISFTAAKNISATVAFRHLNFSEKIDTSNVAAGGTYKVHTEMTYLPKTYTINVTEEMYDYYYIGGSYYAQESWSESAPVYAYIDDVTITYEYDFDYVPPVECKITIDGEEVATVLSGTTYTLPALEAGKYYVGYEDVSEVVITGDLELTTATYTYTITVDGAVVATVDYGTEYTLPALEAGKYYVETEETTFVVTEDKEFTTAVYKYDITIDGDVVATVDYGTEYTLPTLPVSKYYVGVTEKTFTVTSDLTFTTANKDAVDSLIVYDADANRKTGAIAMWGSAQIEEYNGRNGLYFGRGDYMSCGGAGVSDVNMFGSFADYADTAIGVRFWAAAASDEVTNNLKVYIGAPSNLLDNYTQETLAGETVTVPGTTWTQYTVLFNDNVTPEDIASMTHILFTTLEKGVRHYVDDVELLVSEDVDASCDITIDGTVVDTVEYNTVYTLPQLEAGKYYVGDPATKFTVTGDAEFTTAIYTYDITIDGEVVATVDYGTEYTLPQLEAGKYYVGEPETTFTVTEDVEFTTATYEYDITIDGVKVATVAYGDTFVLPVAPDGKQYVDGYVDGQEFVVTSELAFTTEDIPEQDGLTTSYIST
ncbi:MAG: hypothetical protein IJD90_04925, partial [Clostridia bacterium]|nr:hypothetical protein [Clostridia bacterium]